ncbi:hypothetical protein BJF78_14595 [Pseudonocardia sp. CNS-139]|nr:hypothetical protein BJF78_14595 [Pseudonocardia sp. CNS-139]
MTALVSAYARAQESGRAAPLVDDPLARAFVLAATGEPATAAERELPRLGPARDDADSPLWYSLCTMFVARAPFYDEVVLRAIGRGCRQVVLLGAGLDVRSHRLALPADTTVYEVDSADVLDFKESVLAGAGASARARRVLVPADVRARWSEALVGGGLDPAAPTVWIAEGLLPYVTAAEADAILADVTRLSAPTSSIGCDYLNRRARLDDYVSSDADEAATWRMLVTAGRTGPELEPYEWLSRQGWVPRRHDVLRLVRDAGREIPVLFEPARADPLRHWLVSATLPVPHPAGGLAAR